jgi:hypothetical protein
MWVKWQSTCLARARPCALHAEKRKINKEFLFAFIKARKKSKEEPSQYCLK